MRIAYLGRILPCISETFVIREMATLRRRGLDVRAFSIHPPEAIDNPEIPNLVQEVEVLVRPLLPIFWLAHLYFALFFSARYWGCLRDYVLRDPGHQGHRWRRWQYFAISPYTAWRLRSLQIDHVHGHMANVPATIAMMAARLAGISFSFTLHSYYDTYLDNLLFPEKLTAAAAVVSVSRYYLDMLPRRYPEAAKVKIDVVRCGIDPESYVPQPHPRNDPPLLVSVARLTDTKGLPTLIQACGILRDQGVPLQCRIIGDGPDLEDLQKLIAQLQLQDRVFLVGSRQPPEVKAAYREADLMSLPCCYSRDPRWFNNHDCIPYVLMESMAMGLPVISTRLGGIPELIQDGETGLLVEPEDPEGLAVAIARILKDEDWARRLAQAGRKFVMQEFGADRNAQRLQEIFTRVVEARSNRKTA
jgi:colanic acid/amylovoran biosynthesis glycosyltransferase